MAGESSLRKGLEDVVISDSSISLVEGEKGELVYRGFDIGELVPSANYESVVHLLLYGEPPEFEPPLRLMEALSDRRSLLPRLERVVDSLPGGLPPLEALRTLMSALGDGSFGYPPTIEDGLELIARTPTILARYVRRSNGLAPVGPRRDLAHVANYLWMLTGELVSPPRVRALERYFIMLADHGMNASTLALRVVVSTDSDLISGAVAALGALKGPAHGGAPSRVVDMLDSVGSPERAEAWVEEALSRRERLYGFGHRAYKVEDPRAILLKRTARGVADPRRLELAEAVEAAALAALHRKKPDQRLYTNVEFYGALVLEAVGLPRNLFTATFALARTVGWAAHAIEQSKDNRLIRPEVRYIGPPRGRSWPQRPLQGAA